MPTTIDLFLDRHVAEHTPDQLHGLACALLEGPSVDHNANVKAFTVRPLREEQFGQAMRLTLLDEQDQRGRTIAPQQRLGSQFFTIVGRRDEFVPFESLATSKPRRRVILSFETPTYFSRNGRDLPLPDPVSVFRSFAQRWNLYAPPTLHIAEETRDRLLSTVVITAAEVETVSTPAAHRVRRTGFIGPATFELNRGDPHVEKTFAALARASEYLGVGAQTTRGFGVCLERDV